MHREITTSAAYCMWSVIRDTFSAAATDDDDDDDERLVVCVVVRQKDDLLANNRELLYTAPVKWISARGKPAAGMTVHLSITHASSTPVYYSSAVLSVDLSHMHPHFNDDCHILYVIACRQPLTLMLIAQVSFFSERGLTDRHTYECHWWPVSYTHLTLPTILRV